MKVTCELKIADWARIEEQRKIWAEGWNSYFANVRCTFVLLFFTTILVFIYNHQVQVQTVASIGLHKAAKKVTVTDKLQTQALKHEKEVDQINE